MRLDNRSCALCDDIATGSMELIGIGIVDLCAHCQRSHLKAAELRATVRREKAGDFMMRYQAAVERKVERSKI